MALGNDIYIKIFEILKQGYFQNIDELIENLCNDFEKAGLFGGKSKREDYEKKLNNLILQYKSSENINGNKSVETFLRKMSDAGLSFDDDVINSIIDSKEHSRIKNEIIEGLSQGWGDVSEDIKFLTDQSKAQEFIEDSIAYEKELRQTYHKTQKVASIFSKYGQKSSLDITNQDVQKYYTFFFLDTNGKQLKDVISITDEYFETLLTRTSFARLSVASFNEEKRKKKFEEKGILDQYVLKELDQIQNLGYGITGSQTFKMMLNLAGGQHQVSTGQQQELLLNDLQERYNILVKANDRGLIRDIQGKQIPAKRLTEMLLHDDVFDSLREGKGYRWNVNENIAAAVEGDYEQNGVSHSIKTFGAGNSSIQLMPASLEENFKNIFSNRDTFKAEITKRLGNKNQSTQKELNGVIDDIITRELGIVSQGQDFLTNEFDKIIQNNPILQSLGITSDVIQSIPEFQKIYQEAKNSNFTSRINDESKKFLENINKDKEGFYKGVIDNYIINKYNKKTGKDTIAMQKWKKQYNYESVEKLDINFIVPSEEELMNQVSNSMEQAIANEPPLVFNLTF